MEADPVQARRAARAIGGAATRSKQQQQVGMQAASKELCSDHGCHTVTRVPRCLVLGSLGALRIVSLAQFRAYYIDLFGLLELLYLPNPGRGALPPFPPLVLTPPPKEAAVRAKQPALRKVSVSGCCGEVGIDLVATTTITPSSSSSSSTTTDAPAADLRAAHRVESATTSG